MSHNEFDFHDDVSSPIQTFLSKNVHGNAEEVEEAEGISPDFPDSLFKHPLCHSDDELMASKKRQ